MTDSLNTKIVTGYLEAWDTRDLDKAASYLSPTIEFQTPIMKFEGLEAWRKGVAVLLGPLESLEILAVLGEDDAVYAFYNFNLKPPIGKMLTAEMFRVRDGKIQSARLLFDPRPFLEAQQAAGPPA